MGGGGWELREGLLMHAMAVRRGHPRWRDMIAGAALAFLIAVIPTSVQGASTSSPPASPGYGETDSGAVANIGNWPDPM